MKKVSGTRRLLAVVLTIAMLLQNSAGVLATDGANAVSNLSQEQSTEQTGANAVSEQMDANAEAQQGAGKQDGENADVSKKDETPETQAPQTDAPQADTPKTEATETDAPQTGAPETTAPQTETPQTSAPETQASTDTQKTPGLTQPDGDMTETDDTGMDKGSDLIQENGNSESGGTQEKSATGNNASGKDEDAAENILLEDGIMPIADPEYITTIRFIIEDGATWEDAPSTIAVKKDNNASAEELHLTKERNNYNVEVPANEYEKNKAILFKPENEPKLEGKIFEFWYKDENDSEDYFGGENSTTIKNTQTTLRAKWGNPTCKITYMLNGGDTDSIKSFPTTYTVGGTEIDFSKYIPTRTFKNERKQDQDKTYNFLGWYSDTDYKNKVTSTKGLSGDITLYAKWEAVGRVRYWLNDTTNTGIEWDAASSLSEEAWDVVNKKTRGAPGTADYSGPYYIDSKFYSQAEGNDVVGETAVIIPTEVPVRTGYIFSQWKQSSNFFAPGATDIYNSNGRWEYGEAGTSFADDTVPNYQTYTAQWNECQVTITYKATEGGTVRVNNGTDTAKTETSETVGADTGAVQGAVAEAKRGYHFTGWKVENNENILTEDVTLAKTLVDSVTDRPEKEGYTPIYHKATFVATFVPDTYTVIYDSNVANGSVSGNMEPQVFFYGEKKALIRNAFTRSGYTFMGWMTRADGTDVEYADQAEVQDLPVSSDGYAHLYARWIKKCKITYDLNGQSNDKYTTSYDQANKNEYTPGVDEFLFGTPTYKVNGTDAEYHFLGWFTDDGTQKTGITKKDDGDITVHARWRAEGRVRYWLHASSDKEAITWALGVDEGRILKDPTATPTSYSGPYYIDSVYYNNNTIKNPDNTIIGEKQFAIPTAKPVRTGYYFDYWYSTSESSGFVGEKLGIEQNTYDFPYAGRIDDKGTPNMLTLHAHWTPYTYTANFHKNAGEPKDTVQTQTFTYDVAGSLGKDVTFTREGYIFKGWATEKGGTAVFKDPVSVLNWEAKSGEGTVVTWKHEDKAVMDLYAVWEPDIKVTLEGYTGVYDGKMHEATYTGTMEGDTVFFYTKAKGEKNLSSAKATNVSDSVSGIYMDVTRAEKTVTFGPVDVVVTKRPVRITSGSGTKEYDGTALTNGTVTPEATTRGRGFIEGEGAVYTVTGSQTTAGESDNTFTYVLNSNTKAENYTIILVPGKLTVTRAAGEGKVTLGDWTYGNQPAEESSSVKKGEYREPLKYWYRKADEDSYTDVKPTDAGDYVVKAVWPATDNYQQLEATDEFTIFRRKVEIYREETYVHDAAKTYVMDITADCVKPGSSFAIGDKPEIAEAKISGSEIGVYETVEPAEPFWSVSRGDADVSANYELTISGKMTIIPSITYVLNGKTKEPYSVTNPDTNLGYYTPGETNFEFADPTYQIYNADKGETYRYVFLGWFTQNEGGVEKTGITKDDRGDITVYARWRAEGKVRYWLHASDEDEKITWDLGTDATRIQPDKPSKKDPAYVGPYYIDSGFYNGIANNEKTVSGESYFRIPSAVPLRTGYKFDFWYTESENNDYYAQALQPGASYEFPYSGSLSKSGAPNTFTMHAHWTPYTYKAKFHKNAGEKIETVREESFTYGEEGTLGNVVYTREGYSFEGWALSPKGPVLFREAVPVLNWKAGTDGTLVEWKQENGAVIDLYAVWKPQFDVTVTGFDVVYDGHPHKITVDGTIEGDEVTYSYTAGGQEKTVTEPVTATDVAQSAGSVTVTVKRGGATHTEIVDAVIRKRPVTLQSADRSKEFDGEPLTNGGKPLVLDGREQTGDTGWAAGEGLNESATVFDGTITVPGTAENTFEYKLTDRTKEGNYEITCVYGTLEVKDRATPYEITVTANSGTAVYNGKGQTVSGFESLKFTVNGQVYTVSGLTAGGSGRNAGEYPVSISGDAHVLTETREDVTRQFTVKKVDGKLTITRRALTLISASATKKYDANPLTAPTVTVSEPGFADGEGASYNVTGSQLTVGSSRNEFTYRLNLNTDAGNYDITQEEGTLTVLETDEKFAIVAEAKSDSVKYDGAPHTVSGLVRNSFEFNGVWFTLEGLSAEASGTDAGTYEVKVTGTPTVKDADGNDVTSQFEVTSKDGRLEISKRTVTLESGSATKKYAGDGKALTSPNVTVTGDGFVSGEASPVATGSIVYVGEVVNTIDIGAQSGFKAENYIIKKTEGRLRVTDGTAADPLDSKLVVTKTHDDRQYKVGEKVTFTVTVKNIYNGTRRITLTEQAGVTFIAGTSGASLSKDGRTATFESVPSGKTVTITAVYTVTDADVKNGSFTNNVTAAFSGTDRKFAVSDTVGQIDRSCAYTVKFVNRVNGQEIRSSIGPVAVGYGTVVSEATRGENGTVYKNIKITGYRYAGSSESLTVTTDKEKNVLTLYYEPDLSGVRVEGFDVTYDGKRHTILVAGTTAADEVTFSYTAGGVAHSGDSAVSAVNVSESVDSVTVTVKRGGVAQTYSVPAKIRPRTVKLKSMDLSKEFDGEPLTNGNAPLILDGIEDATEPLGPDEGWADGEGCSYEFTGSVIWKGEYPKANTYTYIPTSNTKLENYEILCEYGELKISSRTAPYEITVEANSGTFTYDGEQKTVSGLKGAANGELRFVADGHTYLLKGLTASETQTDAGTWDVEIQGDETIKIYLLGDNEHNLKNQFNLTKRSGMLKIAPRPVTLRSGSSTKEYDGKPLTNSSVTATGFVGTDGADYKVSGSRTLPGSSKNIFTYTLNEGTRAENYIITKQEGTLTVTDRAVKYVLTVRAKSAAYTYDGTEKTVSGLESRSFIVNGKNYTVEGLSASASGTNVQEGGYPAEVVGTAKVLDELGNDVTAQFEIKTEPGTLMIKKRRVTLRSADKTKEYDGTPLTNGSTPLVLDGTPDRMEILGREEGWADGEGILICSFSASLTNIGSVENEFTCTLMEGTLEENYQITAEFGTLTVVDRDTPYQVTVRAKSLTGVYDGTEKSVEGFETLTFDVNGESYTVSGLTAQAKGTDAGIYEANVQGSAVVKDAFGRDVTTQFKVVSVAGKLTIDKRPVTLESADLEKTYDGTPLTNGNTPLVQDGHSENENEGWVKGQGAEIHFTGSLAKTGTLEEGNTFDYILRDGTKKENYEITVKYGSLTLTARTEKYEIDVTAASGEFLYDGTAHEVSGFVGASKLSRAAGDNGLAVVVNGRKYTVMGLSASASGTDVKEGGYPVKVEGTEKVLDEAGIDVTEEFTVIRHDGVLTISPRRLTLTSGSAEKKYDGTELREPDVIVEGDGFAEAGQSGALQPEAYAEATGRITCVGSMKNTITIRGGANYKEQNYIITWNEGILTVTDGTPANPLNPDRVVTKKHDGSREYKAGNTVEFTVTATNIYNVEKTLTLTELEGASFVVGTSGAVLSADGRTATFEQVAPGKTVTITAVHVITEADVEKGSYDNEVTVEFSGPEKTFRGRDTVDEIDRDCTYIVRFVELDAVSDGDLRNPIGPVTVKYGTVVDDMTTADGRTAGETTTMDVEIPYCEIEIPGYKFAGADDPLTVTTNTENNVFFVYYEKDASSSKLSVEGVNKTYDGRSASVEVTGQLEDDQVSYSYTIVEGGEEKQVTTQDPPTLKDVKDSRGEITVTVKRRNGIWTKTVPATITPRKVTLQSADLTKKYDGQPLVNGNTPLVLDGVAGAGETIPANEGWVDGEEVSYRFTGSQTKVGAAANSFEVIAGKGTDLSNYTIEKKEGKLTVTAADAQPTAGSQTEPQTPQTEKPKAGAKLTVTKSIISGDDGHLLGLAEAKFYVTLFSDAKLTKQAADVQELDFDLNTAVASVTYRNLKPGTYYVAEVNAKGKVVSSGKYGGGVYTANYAGNVQKVTIKENDRSVKFSFENLFLELPETQYYRDLGRPKDRENGNSKSKPEDEQETEPESGAQANNGTDTVSAGTEAAKTGDGTPIEWMLLLLAASGMLLILTEERRRRSRS